MYIFIPLSLIAVSFLGVLFIVLRKMSYLNKLYTLNTAGNEHQALNLSLSELGSEFFPELAAFWNKAGINKYKSLWLIEAEKLLRKTRVVFLRIDRLSDVMIKKIRRIHLNEKLNKPDVKETISVEEKVNVVLAAAPAAVGSMPSISQNFLKNEEERLIMEIAANPKNPKLYEALGDVCLEMDNFSDAKESYEAAIELDPQNESLKKKLSSALERLA